MPLSVEIDLDRSLLPTAQAKTTPMRRSPAMTGPPKTILRYSSLSGRAQQARP